MSVIDLGRGTSAKFEIGGLATKSKGDVSISTFNRELKAAIKSGEKVDFTKLEQVAPPERKRLDTKSLRDYILKHKEDKAHVQEIFGKSSPVRELYQQNEEFAPKENLLKRLIGPLLNFLADPSLENLKKIAGGLVTEDGKAISNSENILFTGLDRDQKLAPLATALRAIGLSAPAGEMKEGLTNNPEDQTRHVGKETVEALIKESLTRLNHIIDDSGNLLQANGDVLQPALNIRPEDIDSLNVADPDSLTVREGTLKWSDFAANAFRYFSGKNPGKAVDYVNTVMAIYNRQMQEKVNAASSSDAKADIKATNEEVIDIFSSRLSREFGGEGFSKAFEASFARGAFASEAAKNAIVGQAADKAGQDALTRVSKDLSDTADSKGNGLAEKTGLLGKLVNGDQYTILDLEGVINSRPSTSSTALDYSGNKLTLVDVSKAYRKSAETISSETAKELGKQLLGTSIGDHVARNKYLSGDPASGDPSIRKDASEIEGLAKQDATAVSHYDVFNKINTAITKNIQAKGFLVNRSDATKIAKDLAADLISTARINKTKANQKELDDFETVIHDQISNGNVDFKAIIDGLLKAEADPTKLDAIKARIRVSFDNSARNQTFLNKFINHNEIESLSSFVKAESIQDLVKSNKTIEEFILRQAENKGLNVSSIEELTDTEKGLLADASPEAALIFASSDLVKDDNKRAEMAMLGLLSILKAEPTLLANSDKAKAIVKKVFSKQAASDDVKATTIANKLMSYVATAQLKLNGYTDPTGASTNLDISQLATLAGASLTRAQYTGFVASNVAYARESVTADKLARMVNAHTSSASRAQVHETIQAVADHLTSVAQNLEGTSFDEVQTAVTKSLTGTALAMVNNMFFPGDQFDTLGTSQDTLAGNKAPQTIMDAATRLKMIIPRLYLSENAGAASKA